MLTHIKWEGFSCAMTVYELTAAFIKTHRTVLKADVRDLVNTHVYRGNARGSGDLK